MRAEVLAAQTTGLVQYSGGGTQYIVQIADGTLYLFYVDTGSDLAFKKSTNKGVTWSNPTVIFTGTIVAFAVWYDRWSGIAKDRIHLAYTESGASDILYRHVDTAASDALATQTVVFAGTSSAAGGALSITVTRGENLIVAGSIDAGAEDGAWKSTTGGSSWAAIADPSEAATQDQYMLLPGWNADNQDAQLIFWDASANEISVKRYDNSANTWAETVVATGMTDIPAATSFPHTGALVDLANSRNILIAWSNVDVANSDLRCFLIDDTTITEVTNVVLNSADDQGLAAIALNTDTNELYAFYVGASNGSETYSTAVNIYYKVSTDFGTTWGAEQRLTTAVQSIKWLISTPRFTDTFAVAYHQDVALDEIKVVADIPTIGGSITTIG